MFRWPSGKAEQLTHHLLGAWSVRRPDGFAHANRMAAYADIFARALGATAEEAEKFAQLAALHDIGELALPDAILNSSGKLTVQETALKRRHTTFGRELLAATPSLYGATAASVACHHHERWDGSGYPDALVGEACPREARVIGILDAYDNLRNSEPNSSASYSAPTSASYSGPNGTPYGAVYGTTSAATYGAAHGSAPGTTWGSSASTTSASASTSTTSTTSFGAAVAYDDNALRDLFLHQRGRQFDPFLVDALVEILPDLRLLVPRSPTVQLRAPAPYAP